VNVPPPPVAARLAGVESSPVREILALTQRPGVISFAGGLPAPELFPADELRDAFAQALAGDGARTGLQYSTTEGDPRLRAALAAVLTARGLPTTAGEVVVTTGSQQGLSLVAAVLLDPGDTVLVEEPSYLAALQCFAMAGARVVPVACDEDGLDPDALAPLVAEHRPKLLYTIPTFQNPTGRTLPVERRAAVARAAASLGLWVLEDDPYRELRFEGEPLAPVASYPGAEDRVIASSSLSKVLAPGLRVGWLRAPASVRRALVVAKQAADLHTSTIDQAAAAIALSGGWLDAHLVRARAAYGERRDALVDGLGAALPPGSAWNRPAGGMFVWARLPEGHDAAALLRRAIEHDVAFVPGAPFYAGPPDPATLRLSFTAHPVAEIHDGLARLAGAAR
jgi:DNA-binding transcriptional MocR family regulator